MGNDSSRLKGLVIDKNSVEANDFWTLYNAESPTSNEEGKQLLSIFQGEAVVNGQLWINQGPMERAIKNLMIYRHPHILKYVTTWEQGGHKYLATERVRPLVAILSTQTDIQVCLGLRTVLCSLIFLVEKAMARHLNICTSSIYMSDNGSWRLGGFEFVWKSKEVTKSLLDLTSTTSRYKAAIDPSETKENCNDSIEQFAFATLCEEILSKCSKGETATPHTQEFREYCAIHLKHKNVQMRPKLSAILLHPYFNHEFVLIHSFLFELPLKSVQEKQDFFTGLIDRLRYFNEEVVGTQLVADLLSRMVLLDPTAQLCVTPYVLKTKTDHSGALFSNATYSRHLMPHIKKMFRLRDAQIRLILLEYFMEFVRLLSKEELQEFILPHLIAGMNDTNDVLVAKTLRCLADLVPILGSATVIGGNRSRLFSDGRPQALPDSTTHWVEPRSITPVIGNAVDYMVSGSPLPELNTELSNSFSSLPQAEAIEQLDMPLRLSPDGGEDDKIVTIISDGINSILETETATIEHSSENVEETLIESIISNATSQTNIQTAAQDSITLNPSKGAVDIDDDDEWSDWENDELQRLNNDIPDYENTDSDLPTADNRIVLPNLSTDLSAQNLLITSSSSYATLPSQMSLTDSYRTTQSNASSSTHSLKPPKINDDLSTLDIQVQKSALISHEQNNDEFDFFKDMEPVIETKSNILLERNHIPVTKTTQKIDEEVYIDSNRFAAVPILDSNPSEVDTGIDDDNGWGVDEDVVVDWKV